MGAHCLPGGCSGCMSVAQRAAGGGAAEGARVPRRPRASEATTTPGARWVHDRLCCLAGTRVFPTPGYALCELLGVTVRAPLSLMS